FVAVVVGHVPVVDLLHGDLEGGEEVFAGHGGSVEVQAVAAGVEVFLEAAFDVFFEGAAGASLRALGGGGVEVGVGEGGDEAGGSGQRERFNLEQIVEGGKQAGVKSLQF